MRNLIAGTAILALLTATTPAFAQVVSGSTSGAVSGSTSQANAQGGVSQASNGAATAGNAQNLTFNSSTPDTLRTAPQVYAPALTTTLTETCMGSTSLGGSGIGFGVTIGSTWRDKDCVRRLTARELAQTLGEREAARAIMCNDDAVREAFNQIGHPCPGQAGYQPPVAEAPAPPTATLMSAPPPPAEPTPQAAPQAAPEAAGERG